MSTILQLKSLQAANLSQTGANLTVADLVVNGIDMGLFALNQAKKNAELANDFSFQRQMLTLTVDPTTGASLSDAVIQGTTTTADIKTIVEMGVFDVNSNFRPIEWTTAEESQERQRQENRYEFLRYPTDGQALTWPAGQRRFILRNNQVFCYPHTNNPAIDVAVGLGIEAYVFSADWTVQSNSQTLAGSTGVSGANTTYYKYGQYNSHPLYLSVVDGGASTTLFAIWYHTTSWVLTNANSIGTVPMDYLELTSISQNPAGTYVVHGAFGGTPILTSADADTTSDIWLTKGSDYLLWQSIVELNQRFKFFVPRTEGNLPPPVDKAAIALQNFIEWDIMRFEQFRRHGR